MKRREWEWLEAAAGVALIVALVVALLIGQRDCSRRGGVYVRGLVWMECVK